MPKNSIQKVPETNSKCKYVSNNIKIDNFISFLIVHEILSTSIISEDVDLSLSGITESYGSELVHEHEPHSYKTK